MIINYFYLFYYAIIPLRLYIYVSVAYSCNAGEGLYSESSNFCGKTASGSCCVLLNSSGMSAASLLGIMPVITNRYINIIDVKNIFLYSICRSLYLLIIARFLLSENCPQKQRALFLFVHQFLAVPSDSDRIAFMIFIFFQFDVFFARIR